MKKLNIELLLLIVAAMCLVPCCNKAFGQDTSKAQLLLRQGKNYHKVVEGYVITVKDSCSCKPVGYLTIRKKQFPAKYKVQDYRIIIDL